MWKIENFCEKFAIKISKWKVKKIVKKNEIIKYFYHRVIVAGRKIKKWYFLSMNSLIFQETRSTNSRRSFTEAIFCV